MHESSNTATNERFHACLLISSSSFLLFPFQVDRKYELKDLVLGGGDNEAKTILSFYCTVCPKYTSSKAQEAESHNSYSNRYQSLTHKLHREDNLLKNGWNTSSEAAAHGPPTQQSAEELMRRIKS
eukprot:1150692-Pelagomonas_calceolata.AAC.2